jgi:putative spermidine/putrescine transport system ATP-binding protein
VVDAARGELTVAGQAVRVARRFEGGTGKSVNIALRPEMVKLGDGPEGSNRVKGKVIDVSFLGSIVRIRVAVGGDNGPIVSLDEFNESTLKLPEVGETLTINFPADGPLVLDTAPADPAEVLIAQA